MSRSDQTADVYQQLKSVMDPELRVPITEIGMVGDITLDDGVAGITIKLTTSACPMRSRITDDVTAAAVRAPGVRTAAVTLDVMSPEERQQLKTTLQAGAGSGINRFAAEDSLTKVYLIASGKGGVGKSTVTVNLAASLAESGLKVGLVDADIHGFSVPDLMGITTKPTRVDDLILPVIAHEVKVISIGMFVDGSSAVAWRGPMLHRALEQFLTDVHFGDLDVLLVDLPPGTGDIAISAAQLLPHAEIIVVTTPQMAAASVAERAGSLSTQTNQKVAAVVENMGPMQLPDGSFLEVFGSGGGVHVAQRLTEILEYDVELAGTIPLDTRLRSDSDEGHPAVLQHPESPAANALRAIADTLASRTRGLRGKKLPVTF